MSVVLRCPNCGTTQAAGGECEACHEAQVRYFCTNHEPGLWIAGETCAACDARRDEATLAGLPLASHDAATRLPASAPRTSSDPASSYAPRAYELPTAAAGLWGALAGRMARSGPPSEWESPSLTQAGGCLARLALVAILLILALVAALVVLQRYLA